MISQASGFFVLQSQNRGEAELHRLMLSLLVLQSTPFLSVVAFVRFVDAADALAKMLRLLVLCEKPKKIRERERVVYGEAPFERVLSSGPDREVVLQSRLFQRCSTVCAPP